MKTEILLSLIHQIIITFSTFNNNTKSLHQFINLNTQSIISTTTCSKSITTTNQHEFLHNPTTTTHNSTIPLNNTIYIHIHEIWHTNSTTT